MNFNGPNIHYNTELKSKNNMEDQEKRHYAVIDPYKRKITLKMEDKVIAESTNALILKEVAKSVYDPTFYIPKEDIKINLEKEEGKSTHCPIKGEATYYQPEGLFKDGYFAWSYEKALPRAKKIDGYVSFNPEFVTIISEPV